MTTEERIERLEQNNRRLLAGLVTVILLGIGVAAIPKPGGDVVDEVRARAFILVDDNGKTRAALLVSTNGPGLYLLDGNKQARVSLDISKDMSGLADCAPGLVLADKNGTLRVQLVTSQNDSWLQLSDKNNTRRVRLDLDKDEPALDLLDETGKTIWRTP